MKEYVYYFKKNALCFAACFMFCITAYGQKQNSSSSLEKIIAYSLSMENSGEDIDQQPTVEMLASPAIYKINAGGWEAPGSWGRDTKAEPSPYVTATSFESHRGINGLSFFMENSRKSGHMLWDFPVDNGNYIVTLHFVEGHFVPLGWRAFDVEIEGKKALEDFDIVKFVGIEYPVSLNFSVEVTDNNLDLDFLAKTWGGTIVSAIVVSPGSLPNQDPILSQTSRTLERKMKEGTVLRIPIKANDFDSPQSAINVFGGHTGEPLDFVSVVDNGDGTGEMIIEPGYDDSGIYSLIIAAEDEDGLETGCDACWALVDLTIEDTPEGSSLYRVNAGDWHGVNADPVDWTIDSYGNPSPFLVYARFGAQSHNIVSNSTDAPDNVFDQSRVAWFSDMLWEFPVINGNYTVNLYFVESYFDNTGGRIFDVVIEDAIELDDFDILSETSKNVPLQKSITTQVMDGRLNIEFERHLNDAHPIVAAIEIIYNGETAPSIMDEVHVDASGANNDLARMVSVYPNPVEDRMTLTLPESVKGPVSIRLVDRNSQVKYQGTHNSDVVRNEAKFMIDANLPAGIYHAEILANDSKHIIRIIKK